MDDGMGDETTLAASAIRKALDPARERAESAMKALDLARNRAEFARAEVVRLERALSELMGASRIVPDMSVMARVLRVLTAAPDGLLRAEVEARLWDDGGDRLGPNTVMCALKRGVVRGLLVQEQADDQRTGGGRPPKRWRLAPSQVIARETNQALPPTSPGLVDPNVYGGTDHACPVCGAGPGQQCSRPDGTETAWVHVERGSAT